MKATHLIAIVALSFAWFAGTGDVAADIVAFGSGANSFNMEFVPIGNPGNPADTTGSPSPAGSVAYNYNMGKFEVSRDMVSKASTAGNLGITLADMTSFGGNGVDRPATGVSWNEAARFVNWLNTSQGFSPAYKFTTQPGDGGYSANSDISLWASGDAGFNVANPYRNSRAHYFLPSVDEWYKAAYFNPSTGTYVDFPTGSDTAPTPVTNGTAPNTAVYDGLSPGPADIMLAGGLSLYDTMGQGGNASEWQETELDRSNNLSSSARMVKGGSWLSIHFILWSVVLDGIDSPLDSIDRGFRVASVTVPEASQLLFGGVVAVGLCGWRWLTRRHGQRSPTLNS